MEGNQETSNPRSGPSGKLIALAVVVVLAAVGLGAALATALGGDDEAAESTTSAPVSNAPDATQMCVDLLKPYLEQAAVSDPRQLSAIIDTAMIDLGNENPEFWAVRDSIIEFGQVVFREGRGAASVTSLQVLEDRCAEIAAATAPPSSAAPVAPAPTEPAPSTTTAPRRDAFSDGEAAARAVFDAWVAGDTSAIAQAANDKVVDVLTQMAPIDSSELTCEELDEPFGDGTPANPTVTVFCTATRDPEPPVTLAVGPVPGGVRVVDAAQGPVS